MEDDDDDDQRSMFSQSVSSPFHMFCAITSTLTMRLSVFESDPAMSSSSSVAEGALRRVNAIRYHFHTRRRRGHMQSSSLGA